MDSSPTLLVSRPNRSILCGHFSRVTQKKKRGAVFCKLHNCATFSTVKFLGSEKEEKTK